MTPEELAALTRAVAKLFERWQVSDETGARILAIDLRRYRTWKRGDMSRVDDDLILRLVVLLNIHVQLRSMFIGIGRGYAWMRRPNDAFGQSPIDLIASGELSALARLQAYLAAETEAPL
ncbi:antitoxin Xre/MbcA/ParS toxin-binding domain-containing protein [Bosea sp. ASV33]|uniref:antitoxin Xre/MbcA/ParS toxin-binding domain-containing protein n=1 Tax=Bosea sp. ASV33 TaxID=2795106 RepID=UPI0018ED670D|nr:antitoxin Xre/MbcA/ParS toxin-binding domain-containing protein [Bosea sp. ASV33]